VTRDTSSLWNEALSIQSENAEIARLHDDMARLEDGVARLEDGVARLEDGVARLGKEMSCLNLTVSRALVLAASIRCAAWVTAAACALAALLAVLRRY